jgi:glycerol-3-phosphate acyltransferase PlsY
MSKFIFLSIFAYLFGSVPFAFLIGKLKGVDIRKIGSKSITETNLARALGWRYGVLGGILDVSKSAIPAFLAKTYLFNPWQIIFVSFFPIFGHIFPIYLGFRHGGRGASTFFGASIVLFGAKYFLPFFLVWILIFILVRIMSLTNLIFPWLFSGYLFFLQEIKIFPFAYFVFGILVSSLITFALRENIKRLIKGEEKKTPLKF